MYEYGYAHNAVLDSLYESVINLSDECSEERFVFLKSEVDSVLTLLGQSPDDTDFDPAVYEDLYLAWCEEDDVAATVVWLSLLDEFNDILSAYTNFPTEEREFIYDALIGLANGTADHDQLILDYQNLLNPFKGGVVSGTIIAIGIASDCYWSNVAIPPSINENPEIEPRGLGGAVLADATFAYFRFLVYMYDNPDFANDNCTWGPGCGDDLGRKMLDAAASGSSHGLFKLVRRWFS